VLFWKLQAEAFLGSCGVTATVVVKPCGLGEGDPAEQTLLTGHRDALLRLQPPMVRRSDVARVVVRALLDADGDGPPFPPFPVPALRFDLCARDGTPTGDEGIGKLLEGARWPWEGSIE
jgi:hypothetical protein